MPTQEEKTIFALVERIYLIIVSREGYHARFELPNKIFESFHVVGCITLQSVYGHEKYNLCMGKERYNLCMNRGSCIVN